MYCTLADLEQRLDPQVIRALSDDDADGVADEGVISALIADADALIDTYLRHRFLVPFTAAPELVRGISTAIAIYLLLSRRQGVVPAEFLKRYESALNLLDHLARGLVSLEAPQPSTSPQLPQSTREADERTFDSEELGHF